jgi:hypothetical protein
MRERPYSSFIVLGLVLAVVVSLLSDVASRVSIAGESLGYAIEQHTHYAAAFPISTLVEAVPFLLLGLLAAAFSRRKGFQRSLVMFIAGAFVLAVLYFGAYQDSQRFMLRHMWTAAALSVGFLTFKSVPVLLVCLVAGLLLPRQRSEADA